MRHARFRAPGEGIMLGKVLFLILITPLAFAKTIIITDIDDTIKDSRVRNKWELIRRGPQTGPEMVIPGMQQALLRLMQIAKTNQIFYVSKIPKVFEDYHQEFLNRNYFPYGLLISRGFQSDFKYQVVMEIIRLEKPTEVILIGDNGESDPKIYSRIRSSFKRNKDLSFKVFIREAYPDKYRLYKGQVLFSQGKDLELKFHASRIPKKCRYIFRL